MSFNASISNCQCLLHEAERLYDHQTSIVCVSQISNLTLSLPIPPLPGVSHRVRSAADVARRPAEAGQAGKEGVISGVRPG
jgi:hypothetical protein